jgi:DNA-binding FadR family transcriptional regulator
VGMRWTALPSSRSRWTLARLIAAHTANGVSAKLPSERSFAEEHGVAYATVRHAMAVLRERGAPLLTSEFAVDGLAGAR